MSVSRVGYRMVLSAAVVCAAGAAPALDHELAGEDPASLAKAVRERGDAARGATLFFQQYLACAKCHEGGENGNPLGPDLSKMGKEVTDAYLIESILNPSKEIKKGFEAVSLATADGKTVTGLLAEERPDAVVLRDPAQDGKLVTVARKEIEERGAAGGQSIMPPGLANLLATRQQFLDLVKYLREIADQGPQRALALRPDPSSLVAPPLPEYERDLDHAGLIADLDSKSLKDGKATYNLICANCHGTKKKPGSMPTSLQFVSGTFKNGNDPLSMYRTLTHGFGQMPPQTALVPKQKYDVIHYIRDSFLKDENPSQYARVDRDYLARLPKGKTRGPEPVISEPWLTMDYGPSLMTTLEVGDEGANIAYKGIAVRLDPGPGGVSRGRRWLIYDHDTMRVAAAWSGEAFSDWNGINFNGVHEVHPKIVGRVHFANPVGPGWADPTGGTFVDPRPRGRDDRPYGPLPRAWARYKGTYHHGDRVIVSYTVGQAEVLETPGGEVDPKDKDGLIFTRTLNVGPASHELRMRVAPSGTAVALVGGGRASLVEEGGFTLLRFAASTTATAVKVLISDGVRDSLRAFAKASPPPESLDRLTSGGPRRWPEVLKTQAVRGRGDGPFAVDILTHPAANPWKSRMRFSGLDFTPDGRRAYLCDWEGDVWMVDGLTDPDGILAWRRIASGLFQSLGLKIVDGRIYVSCRDQIALLRDLNGDGETDFVECFNDDHQVTEHFHEFAMDLQADPEGNFYYAKAARHGKTALVPQHGTLLRVSKDGARTDILAFGFRAPNGVCLNPDGTFFMTDQEGFWHPKNRINWVRQGRFYGNMWGYHDVTDPSDEAMEPPICWITNAIDRSPGQIVRVEGDAWGPLKGSLLNLSYGYGKIFVVPHERVGDQMQGGVCELPIPQLATGVMRGRFHPGDGQLYACGLFGWSSTQNQPGGFYRIRATGKPNFLPIGLSARPGGIAMTFSGPLDPKAAADTAHYAVKTWSLKRSVKYGSEHYDERPSPIRAARLQDDGRTVFLEIPGITPTWCMEIKYLLKGEGGEAIRGAINNTILKLQE